MIAPKENEFVKFSSAEEELAFLRSCGLVTAKAAKSKVFCYKGAYTRWPVFCRVVGKTSSGAAVLSLPGGEHCISTDYLAEMQTGSAKLYKDACEISAVSSYTAFDVETTGLSPQSDRIIEIGAVRYSAGQETRRFQALVNPGFPISPQISELTGITNSELGRAPDISSVLPEFLHFLGSDPVIAHNAPFDRSFLENACTGLGFGLENIFYDTLKLSREIFPGLSSYKLQDLMHTFELDSGTAHRALYDAKAAAQLFELCKSSPFASIGGILFQ